MNYLFISAGFFISLLIHMFAGGTEYRELNPHKQKNDSDKMSRVWLMGHGTFQMVSVDLLLTAAFLILMGTNIISYNYYLSLFIALLYLGYFIFWLLTLFFSNAKSAHYIQVGQWMIFIIAFVLIILSIHQEIN